jgi:hypothetical protein
MVVMMHGDIEKERKKRRLYAEAFVNSKWTRSELE